MTSHLFCESGLWNWLVQSEQRGEGELRWTWSALPESWGVFVWLLLSGMAIFAVIWLYRREVAECPPLIRGILAGLRVATVLCLILLLLKPSVFYQQVNIVRPVIAVLRDNSISLARGDRYTSDSQAGRLAEITGQDKAAISAGEVTRQQLVNQLTGSENRKWIDAIRQKGNLEIRDFSIGSKISGSLPTIFEPENNTGTDEQPGADGGGLEGGESISPLDCSGAGTDLWQAIRDTLDSNQRLAAIVVVSEGQHNGSEDPRTMARRAGELEIPLFTVGVGDPTPRRNFSVEEVFVRSQVYPNEPFEIESLIQASLPESDTARGSEILISLMQQSVGPDGRPQGEPVEVQSRTETVPAAGSRIRVDFSHTLAEPGQYRYQVVAKPTGIVETTNEDNTEESGLVDVIDEKVRVLLVSGLPNWEYIQLQRLLQRDSNISLSCWLQSMDETRPQEGDDPISTLPRSLVDLGQYNVIILIDPNPEEFDGEWIAALQDFVRNQAGGFMFMAGPQHTAEFLTMNRLKGVLDLLPVRFADAATITASQVIARATESRDMQMQVVPYNLDHPVMSFHVDKGENEMRWGQFPGFAWTFPAISAKPATRVLIESGTAREQEGNQPVLVAGRYGAGNVLYFGFMGTWLWRSAGVQAQYFDRFWIQVVRYLVENRSLQGSRRGVLDSDMTEYELGGAITLVGRLRDEQFEPVEAESIPVIITDENGRTQTGNLQAVPGRPGNFEGTFTATRTGAFTARFDIGGTGNSGAVTGNELFESATYRVVTPAVELDADWLNEQLLRDMANQSGGQYLRLDEIDKLPELLPRLETRAEFNSPIQPAWDLNWLTRILAFSLPVVFLCLEWGLRKWYRLL